MLLVEQKNVRNTLFGHFAVKEPRNCFKEQTENDYSCCIFLFYLVVALHAP